MTKSAPWTINKNLAEQVEENTYIRVGRQDMTGHIDFTTLIRQGEELGLSTFKVLIQAKGVDNPRLLCMREWGKDL